MRLKSRNKIQKYVSDPSETLNPLNNESFEEEFNDAYENECMSSSQKEENMLIFEIFVENLFGDLNRISSKNNIKKESLSNFKRHKEVMLDFLKTGYVNVEARDCFGKSKITTYQQAIFYTEDVITKLLKNLVRDSIDKLNGNYKQQYQGNENFNGSKYDYNFQQTLSNEFSIKPEQIINIQNNSHPNNRLDNFIDCGRTASSTSTLSNKEFSNQDDDLAHTNESLNENDLLDADEDYNKNIKNNTIDQDIDDYDQDEYAHSKSYDNELADQTSDFFSGNNTTLIKEEDGSGPLGDFGCNLCPKLFNKRENLARHLKTHNNEKQLFECKYCSIRFTRKQNLKRHTKIHTGENMFSCTYCNYSCIRKDYLVTHLKNHLGEKAFKCTTCKKGFTHKNDLVRHELIHTGQKAYECNDCDKSFLEKSHLVRHAKTKKHAMKV